MFGKGRIAVLISGLGFFVLAIAGWLSGQPVHSCALRAVIGAAILFVVVKVCSRVVWAILVDVLSRQATKDKTILTDSDDDKN